MQYKFACFRPIACEFLLVSAAAISIYSFPSVISKCGEFISRASGESLDAMEINQRV